MSAGGGQENKTTATLTTQRPAGTATTSLEKVSSRSGCRNWTALVEWRLARPFTRSQCPPRPLPRRVPRKGGKTVGAGDDGSEEPGGGGWRSTFFQLASRRKQANTESELSNARHLRHAVPRLCIFQVGPSPDVYSARRLECTLCPFHSAALSLDSHRPPPRAALNCDRSSHLSIMPADGEQDASVSPESTWPLIFRQ